LPIAYRFNICDEEEEIMRERDIRGRHIIGEWRVRERAKPKRRAVETETVDIKINSAGRPTTATSSNRLKRTGLENQAVAGLVLVFVFDFSNFLLPTFRSKNCDFHVLIFLIFEFWQF
jgi:hypothetical protein